MQADSNSQGQDDLSIWRAEFAAALSPVSQWPDLHPDTEDSSPPNPAPPTPLRPVTVDVAGANTASRKDGAEGTPSLIGSDTVKTQLRVGLPKHFAHGLSELPKRWRTHVFLAAVFGPLGGKYSPGDFLGAAVQLERAAIILRHVLHLGLPVELTEQAKCLVRWIGRACNLRRDGSVPSRLRLPPVPAGELKTLKPRERDEFVRLALSFSRAGIPSTRLVSDEHRFRIACDCIIWHLQSDSTKVPVGEIGPLLWAIQDLAEGGAP